LAGEHLPGAEMKPGLRTYGRGRLYLVDAIH